MQDALVYAVGVAVSPLPVATVLLMLSGPGASANGLGFAGGWTCGVAASAAVLTLLVDALDLTDSKPDWIGVADLVIGGAFLAFALRLWVRWRPRESSPPWLEAVDQFTATRAATLGVVLSGANPKVLALSLGAALSLAQAGANASTTAVTVALFIVIGTAGVVVPVAIYLALPGGRGAAGLTRFRRWLVRNERAVLTALALAIAGFFIRDGVDSFTS